jgi:hypothetical protein
MDPRVTGCETLWEALSWCVRLKGTNGRRQGVSTIIFVASKITPIRNGPSKLEGQVSKGF